ncbi:MAG: proS2 [Parachlamydiales bacterium]|nr:proS2 [Parachlamydiales bacterium]
MTVKTAIQPTRAENYPEWYLSVVKAADLAEHSSVRGCMVIKPWGYSIWENIQRVLDGQFKATGHQNAYFPLFIPLSYFQKEAEHVEGFAKECAVVTHHRLEMNKDGKLVPAGELEEPLIVRPTSEMIIGDSFSKWIESYRDLPLLINQWANIVRWEMRTRVFLRTAEFLWQEGHTAHATSQEAEQEVMKMLRLYSDFCQDYLAMPVICGEKTASERFPGAVATYSIEAMMQDRKALQAGTSHFLGQNFAKSCQIRYKSEQGSLEYAWTTSWGVTTRLIGGLIMTHSDDDGLVLPPRIASAHVVILPIIHDEQTRVQVMSFCDKLKQELSAVQFDGQPLRVILDQRDMRGGDKSWSWIKKGVPLRIEVGLREIEKGQISLLRRDRSHKERMQMSPAELNLRVDSILLEIQNHLLAKATEFQRRHTVRLDKKEELYDFFSSDEKGGFAMCHWNGEAATEQKIKDDLNATIRGIPLDAPHEQGRCILTGEPSSRRVIFAKSY